MDEVGDAFGRLTGTSDEPTLAAAATAVAATLAALPGTTQVARVDLLDALVLLHWTQAALTAAEHTLIDSARRAGVSWQAIAPALGVASRQAAERRFLRLTPAPTTVDTREGAGTRDGRVRAERDRRAGQRAVADWANDNTADLRRLAGQITALPDLGRTAGADIDRLHDALADTDAIALPDLLANARRHLIHHPGLAGEIDAVTARTLEIRDDTQRRRDRPDT